MQVKYSQGCGGGTALVRRLPNIFVQQQRGSGTVFLSGSIRNRGGHEPEMAVPWSFATVSLTCYREILPLTCVISMPGDGIPKPSAVGYRLTEHRISRPHFYLLVLWLGMQMRGSWSCEWLFPLASEPVSKPMHGHDEERTHKSGN